jgi:hypothetical protein
MKKLSARRKQFISDAVIAGYPAATHFLEINKDYQHLFGLPRTQALQLYQKDNATTVQQYVTLVNPPSTGSRNNRRGGGGGGGGGGNSGGGGGGPGAVATKVVAVVVTTTTTARIMLPTSTSNNGNSTALQCRISSRAPTITATATPVVAAGPQAHRTRRAVDPSSMAAARTQHDVQVLSLSISLPTPTPIYPAR